VAAPTATAASVNASSSASSAALSAGAAATCAERVSDGATPPCVAPVVRRCGGGDGGSDGGSVSNGGAATAAPRKFGAAAAARQGLTVTRQTWGTARQTRGEDGVGGGGEARRRAGGGGGGVRHSGLMPLTGGGGRARTVVRVVASDTDVGGRSGDGDVGDGGPSRLAPPLLRSASASVSSLAPSTPATGEDPEWSEEVPSRGQRRECGVSGGGVAALPKRRVGRRPKGKNLHRQGQTAAEAAAEASTLCV